MQTTRLIKALMAFGCAAGLVTAQAADKKLSPLPTKGAIQPSMNRPHASTQAAPSDRAMGVPDVPRGATLLMQSPRFQDSPPVTKTKPAAADLGSVRTTPKTVAPKAEKPKQVAKPAPAPKAPPAPKPAKVKVEKAAKPAPVKVAKPAPAPKAPPAPKPAKVQKAAKPVPAPKAPPAPKPAPVKVAKPAPAPKAPPAPKPAKVEKSIAKPSLVQPVQSPKAAATTPAPRPLPAKEAAAPVLKREPTTRAEKLEDLLEQYKADKITPKQYQERRAKILAEP